MKAHSLRCKPPASCLLNYYKLLMLKRKFISVAMLLMIAAVSALASGISSIERSGSWYYIYDDNGKKTKTLSVSSTGEVLGWGADYFVAQNGSWINLYDDNGRKYKTLSTSSIGRVQSVSATTFTTRSGNWIYTFDRSGKKVSTRSAR